MSSSKVLKEIKYGFQLCGLLIIPLMITSTLGSALLVAIVGSGLLAFGAIGFAVFWKVLVGYMLIRILIDKIYPWVIESIQKQKFSK